MTPKRKIFITILCLLGSLIVVLTFGIAPLIRGISKDAGKLQTQKQELEIFEKETQEIENFKMFSQERKADVEGLHRLFVSSETPIPFIEFLEQYAKPLGIELTIIPGEPKKIREDFWPSLDFLVSSKASYPAAFAFLRAVENAPFALAVENIAFLSVPLSSDVAFTITLKAYTK
ncbi:MAG: hypothetical protein Greene071421_411 [Parcubacteria group bacterium Greene0714_21]|nr:MAG: hypothetical protein Greene041639_64 [Parcubacteria group bacterium Greene0416_39]TSC98175.1 MAG: hypothetical protein Greene101447_138 [Parcubacteria group bacterium Greene1014_47]TSD04045.1 MAG: hypothetical protein Greene071421_411 [Parcubacteria group bacterium Greene0714_21]